MRTSQVTSDRSVWRIAWVIVFGAFASGLDASLANIGLDTIGTDLNADLSLVQWVATGYLLALAVSLPVAGWLGRRVGVGRLWLAALAAFTVASGLCAAAPNIDALIGLRILQGLSGGLLIPAGQTVLGQAVGAGRLGRVMATLGIAVSLGPALGPVIGGLILHTASWRWLFAVNLPVGVIGLLLGLRVIPRGTVGDARRLDWIGLGYISAGLPLLVYALTEWGTRGGVLHLTVLVPSGLGVPALAAFVHRMLRRPDSLLDLRLYRNRVYTAASVATGATGMLMFGSTLLFPLYFQIGHGDSVIDTGLRMLGLGGGTALALPLTGRLTDRYGGGVVSLCGCIAVLAAAVPFTVLSLNSNPVLIQILLVLLGAATAVAAVPTGIAAYKTVTAEQLSDATTQVNIVQRLGGAVGAALFSVVLARGLASGAEAGLHAAFRAMALTAVCAVVAAACLARADRVDRVRTPEPAAAGSHRSPRTSP